MHQETVNVSSSVQNGMCGDLNVLAIMKGKWFVWKRPQLCTLWREVSCKVSWLPWQNCTFIGLESGEHKYFLHCNNDMFHSLGWNDTHMFELNKSQWELLTVLQCNSNWMHTNGLHASVLCDNKTQTCLSMKEKFEQTPHPTWHVNCGKVERNIQC